MFQAFCLGQRSKQFAVTMPQHLPCLHPLQLLTHSPRGLPGSGWTSVGPAGPWPPGGGQLWRLSSCSCCWEERWFPRSPSTFLFDVGGLWLLPTSAGACWWWDWRSHRPGIQLFISSGTSTPMAVATLPVHGGALQRLSVSLGDCQGLGYPPHQTKKGFRPVCSPTLEDWVVWRLLLWRKALCSLGVPRWACPAPELAYLNPTPHCVSRF